MYEYKADMSNFKVTDAYDGDTVKLVLDLGFSVKMKMTLRLAGIDTPELRGDEREAGLVSRNWLREQLLIARDEDIDVIVKTSKDKTGKYGRMLATIYIDGLNINETLVDKGLAEIYVK